MLQLSMEVFAIAISLKGSTHAIRRTLNAKPEVIVRSSTHPHATIGGMQRFTGAPKLRISYVGRIKNHV